MSNNAAYKLFVTIVCAFLLGLGMALTIVMWEVEPLWGKILIGLPQMLIFTAFLLGLDFLHFLAHYPYKD